jgi:ferredoxin
VEYFNYLKNVTTLEFDPDSCTGCGRCIEVCPHHVFRPCGNKIAIQDRDLCMECGACATNCPSEAIRVEAGVGCASGLITEWLRDMKLLRGGSTGGC